MSGSVSVFVRELKLAWSGGGGAALPVGFFAAACSITPFAVGNAVENNVCFFVRLEIHATTNAQSYGPLLSDVSRARGVEGLS